MTTTENKTNDMLNAALQRAVDSAVATVAAEMAKDALAAMLTDEVRAEMVETARHQVEVALNPPAVEVSDEQEQPQPKPPENFYKTVVDFVENYVAINYRRAVEDHDPSVLWCPKWWLHGEVKERFTALWTAFEALRLGKKLEQSLFWLQHFDPMMARIFDPEGPFKHCSVREGHKGLYKVLPTVAADPAVADPRSIPGVEDDSAWVQRPSKLWTRNNVTQEPTARVVEEFP